MLAFIALSIVIAGFLIGLGIEYGLKAIAGAIKDSAYIRAKMRDE